jgi:hypothetical protein
VWDYCLTSKFNRRASTVACLISTTREAEIIEL